MRPCGVSSVAGLMQVHEPVVGLVPRLVVVKNGFKGIHDGNAWDCCVTIYEHILDNSVWYWDDPSQHT